MTIRQLASGPIDAEHKKTTLRYLLEHNCSAMTKVETPLIKVTIILSPLITPNETIAIPLNHPLG